MSALAPLPSPAASPLAVLEPEAELLRVAQALFAPASLPSVLPVLRQACPLSPHVGASAMRALEDVLAKGTVRLLARASAAPRARVGRPEVGWELPRPPRLRFTSSSFELLHWMVTTPLARDGSHRLALSSPEPLSCADQLLFALALDALDAARLGDALRAHVPKTAHALLWVLSPDLGPPSVVPPLERFAELATDEGADLLWLLASWIAPRHLRFVRLNLADPDVERLEGRALAHAEVIDRLTRALLATRRLHGLTFLADVVAKLVPTAERPFDPRACVRGAFPPGVALGQRERIRRASVAAHRAFVAVGALRDRLRAVGFLDDDYEDAQRILHLLEPWDEGRFARAGDVVRLADAIEAHDANDANDANDRPREPT